MGILSSKLLKNEVELPVHELSLLPSTAQQRSGVTHSDAHLGLNICQQQGGTPHLQQHDLTPHTPHAVQQLQTLHTVPHIFQLLPIEITSEQVLQERGIKHRINCRMCQSSQKQHEFNCNATSSALTKVMLSF